MPSSESTIETSSQDGIEVSSPELNNPVDDWAARLDSEIDTLNKETGATLHGKPDAKGGESAKTSRSLKKDAVVENTEEKSNDATEVEAKEEVEVKEETPKGLTEKASVKWGELRSEAAKAKEYLKQVDGLKAELEQARSHVEQLRLNPADTSEMENLRQLNQNYEQELSISRMEATQEYKSNVVQPMTEIVGYVNELAKRYELNSKELLGAFAEQDPSKQSDLISELASSMSERDRHRFYATGDDYTEILRRRDIYQNYSRDRKAQIDQEYNSQVQNQQANNEREAHEYQAAQDAASTKVFGDLKNSIPMLEDEEIASDVQRLSKLDFTQADPELKAYLTHSGAILPHLLKAFKAVKEELEASNKKVLGYRNGSPKAGSGSSENSRNFSNDTGFLEAIESSFH